MNSDQNLEDFLKDTEQFESAKARRANLSHIHPKTFEEIKSKMRFAENVFCESKTIITNYYKKYDTPNIEDFHFKNESLKEVLEKGRKAGNYKKQDNANLKKEKILKILADKFDENPNAREWNIEQASRYVIGLYDGYQISTLKRMMGEFIKEALKKYES